MPADDLAFDQLLACEDPAQRAALLDRLCASDPPQRQRLLALLRAHQDIVSGFLDPAASHGALDPPTQLTPAPSPGLTTGEAEGSLIGPYKLLQQIGEGGFGTVWMAEQQHPVRRRVALKIIKPGMDTREVIARFEQERQALALMDHPHIARVLDAGATPAGRPFFVMELVRGMPVTQFCDQHLLTTRQRLELFTDICRAVQHAHQKGIIHRDLKPSNILVFQESGRPLPKVIDFGIAKATTRGLTENSVRTGSDQMIGTPAYMSPEQAAGDLDIDTRSDIYSLGVLLYELLTGRPPFDTRELMRHGVSEMIRTLRERDPVRPSTALGSLSKEAQGEVASRRRSETPALLSLLRGDLDWVVMKAMEKDRKRRYDSASGLAADIGRHLQDEPVIARPPSLRYRAGRWVRRNKAAFVTATLVLLTLVGGLAVSLTLLFRLRTEENLRRDTEMNRALERVVQVMATGDDARIGDALEVARSAGVPADTMRLLHAQQDLLAGRMADASAQLAPLTARPDAGIVPLALQATAAIMDWRWTDHERALARLKPMQPATRQEFLFKGQAIAHTEPAAGIALMQQAIALEPTTMAYVLLAESQTTLAIGSGRLEDIETAIRSIEAAKTLTRASVVVLSISAWAHATGARLAREHARPDLAALWLALAQDDGRRLEKFLPNPFVVTYRAMQLDVCGDSQAAFDLLERQWRENPHPSLVWLHAESLMRQARVQEAAEILQAHPNTGDVADSCLILALLELSNGDTRVLEKLKPGADASQHGLVMNMYALPTFLFVCGRPAEARAQALAYHRQNAAALALQRPHYLRISEYLAGLKSDSDLITASQNSRWDLSEAHGLIALDHLSRGDRATARRHLEKAAATGTGKGVWFSASRIFLARLSQNPAWPPWIPPAPALPTSPPPAPPRGR